MNLRMKHIPFYIPGILRFSLLLLLLILTLAIIFTTKENVKTVRDLAIQSLENTADGLYRAAENALREKDSSKIGDIFSDRIVAYALIAQKDGNVLYHTNPALKNTKLPAEEIEKKISFGKTTYQRIKLGTGMPAYECNFIIERSDESPEILQLVLQTTAADINIHQAGRMWWITGMLIGILWAAGILFDRFVTNRIKTQAVRENQKRLTLIGQMTASLAHEIRNALGSIKGYAQWLEEKSTEGSPQKEALATVVTGARRIEALVNELLLFSKEEAYHDEPVTLEPLITEALAASAQGRSAGMELNIPPGISVRADREKLLRVIVNGIRNAMDAMVENGSLRIYSYETSRWVSICIEDTGEGITEKDHDRLFTPFYTTKTDGTGLGLAYAKKVVEGMGGTIKLTNRTGGVGAVLNIQLPNGRNKKNGI
jgi:signal transduction histidine kinase